MQLITKMTVIILWDLCYICIERSFVFPSDADFNHLNGVSFEVRKTNPDEFKPFFYQNA
jgi:hypothetical protein